MMLKHNAGKNFGVLETRLNALHNYFDGVTKLFSDLSKSLDTLVHFPYT